MLTSGSTWSATIKSKCHFGSKKSFCTKYFGRFSINPYIVMVHFTLMLAFLFVRFQEDLQQLAGALFGSDHSSVYSLQRWPIHPEHGSSFSHSNGFDKNSTFLSSQFHGELEDEQIARRNFQDTYPDQATGQTLPADTDTDDIDAFVDGLIIDNPPLS